MISVGPLEGKTLGTDGEMHRAVGRPFGETFNCWQFMEQFTVHKYHVTDDADITFSSARVRKKRREKEAPSMGQGQLNLWTDEQAKRVRDAHVHVHKEQLLELIKLAVANITQSTASYGARLQMA